MNYSIREYIINNFKNESKKDIKETINESIKSNDELVLPGLGVMFEVIWNNSNQDDLVNIIKKNLK